MGIGIGILVLLLALAASALVAGVVIMGMVGMGHEEHPRAAAWFTDAAQVLNGEGEPPARSAKLFN